MDIQIQIFSFSNRSHPTQTFSLFIQRFRDSILGVILLQVRYFMIGNERIMKSFNYLRPVLCFKFTLIIDLQVHGLSKPCVTFYKEKELISMEGTAIFFLV